LSIDNKLKHLNNNSYKNLMNEIFEKRKEILSDDKYFTDINNNNNNNFSTNSTNNINTYNSNNNNNNNDKKNNNDNYNNRYFNEGALIGRIFNDEPFVIINNLKINSKSSGPLFLRTNVYNFLNNDFPIGELNLKVIGGILIKSFEEIDQKIGWDKNTNSIEFYNDTEINLDIPNYEKDVINIINKIRNNPCLFAIQYLENMKHLTKSTKDLYQFTITQGKNKFDIFKVNIVIFKLLETFYSNYLENKSKDKKILIMNSKDELLDFLNNKFENKKK
jgi:hypothetical protein